MLHHTLMYLMRAMTRVGTVSFCRCNPTATGSCCETNDNVHHS